jgi:hypothetical protein
MEDEKHSVRQKPCKGAAFGIGQRQSFGLALAMMLQIEPPFLDGHAFGRRTMTNLVPVEVGVIGQFLGKKFPKPIQPYLAN